MVRPEQQLNTNTKMRGEKDIIVLSGEQLKTLAKLVHYQEQHRIKSIAFKSEKDRGQYLRDSLETYKMAVNLIDEAANLQQEKHLDEKNNNNRNHPMTAQIIHDYVDKVQTAVGVAIRTIYHVHLRREYLKNLRAHADIHMSYMNDVNAKWAEIEADKVKVAQRKAQAQEEKKAQLEKAAKLKAEAEAAHTEAEASAKRAAQLEAEAAAENAAKIEDEALREEAALSNKLASLEKEATAVVEKLEHYKKFLYMYMLKWKDPSSHHFSKMLKTTGVTFEKMVKMYQLKLVREKGPEYGGDFKALDDAKKIEVYDEIVKSSGRGSLVGSKLAATLDVAEKALFVIALGNMAWDIYISDSEHRLQTAVKDGAELTASMLGGFVGEVAGAAAASAAVATTVGAEVATSVAAACGCGVAAVSSAFICVTAALTGFGFGIALGALVGLAVTKIFESGGKHASNIVTVQKHPNSPPPPPPKKPKSSVHVYAAPMPNGDLLARQLAYHYQA